MIPYNSQNKNLTIFPYGISKLMPNLRELTLRGPISTINAAHLDGLNKLKEFHFYCNVQSLPGNLFRGTPNLKMISVTTPPNSDPYANSILERRIEGGIALESVGANLLANLKDLLWARFHGNCVKGVEVAFGRVAVRSMSQVLHLACPPSKDTIKQSQ